MTLTIKTRDRVTAKINEFLELKARRGYAIAARAMRKVLLNHFKKMDARPNQRKWPKTHFFAKAARATHTHYDDKHAEARVSLVGYNTLVTGKPTEINPVNTKYLTIPATEAAYGKRARAFRDLRFGYAKNEYGAFAPALVQKKVSSGTGKVVRGKITGRQEASGQVFFWLVKQVHPKPHPWYAPTDKEMKAGIVAELEAYIRLRK